MKKILVPTLTLAVLAGLINPISTVWAQGQAPLPHKVGLIDMAHVFQNYRKFEVLREDLKGQIGQSDKQAKQMAASMKSLQEEMKELKSGSPANIQVEKKLLKAKSEFDAFSQGARRDLMRKESQIYKTVYLEVADAVQKYAAYYNYTLIIRFNRQALDEKATPPEVVQRMNKQVVYFRPNDDITESVLKYLNDKYQKSAGAAPAGRSATRPATTPRRN
ncbi:MAG: OmpH family outer membrane protein [Planctomycetaceae bacterium]